MRPVPSPYRRQWICHILGVPVIVTVGTAALAVGYLAGLLTFKIRTRWCDTCGEWLRCPKGHRRRLRVIA